MSVVTLSDETPIDPDDELLVAYLDGELSREEQTSLENRLVDEDSLRIRLQQLQSGWELLDDLPEPTGSMKLVESTLEMVVSDLVKTTKPPSGWKRHRTPLVIGALCLAGALGAWFVVQGQKSKAYREQLRDLAIAENVDAYHRGSNLELMRLLAANPDWLKMKNTLEEMGDIEIKPIADLALTPVDQRQEVIANLPHDRMNQLNSRWDKFNRFSEPDRDNIRRTAEAVGQAADSEILLKTMQAYEVWAQSLPTELRDRLESSDPKQRRDAVKEAIEVTQLSITRRSKYKLDDETIDSIYIALRHIVRQRINNDEISVNEDWDASPEREWFTIARIASSGRRGPRPPGSGPGSRGSERTKPITNLELNMILWVLPQRALDTLELVAGSDDLLQEITLRTWAEEAFRRKAPFERDESTLAERYAELDENTRNALDLLPPKDLLRELSRDESRFRFRSGPSR